MELILLNSQSHENLKYAIMSDLRDFSKILTGSTLNDLQTKLNRIESFCIGKSSQSFDYIQAHNPFNYVKLSCPLFVDGGNNIILKLEFNLPEFQLEDTRRPLELFKNPLSLINLNPSLTMPFKEVLQNKKHHGKTV